MRLRRASALFCLLAALAAVAFPARGDEPFYKVITPERKFPLRAAERTPNEAAAKDERFETLVSVELLTGPEGVGLAAQEWHQTFEKFGCPLRIRAGVPTDKIEIREKILFRLREVTVVGRLEPNGRLVFAERAFDRRASAALGEWLRELKTYGAQGAPDGKPVWGLDEAQFSELFRALAPVVEEDLSGLSLGKALERLGLPAKYPLRPMVSARRQMESEQPVRHGLRGFAKGTALAVVFSEYGLGFRPLRTPEGSIVLAIEALEKTSDVWPAGWEIPAETPARVVAPRLYGLVTVEFDEQPLTEALAAVSSQTEMPVLSDEHRIASRGIKPDDVRVKIARRQTSYDLVLRRLTNPSLLTYRLRIDEQKRPFVWITTLEAGPARR